MPNNKPSTIRYLDEWRQQIEKFILKNIDGLPPTTKILDIGWGDSSFIFINRGFDLTVLDTKVLPVSKSYKTIQADISNKEDIEKIGELFDIVVCSEVLEHVCQPWLVADNLNDLCKIDGKILVTVPCNIEWHPGLPYYGDYWRFMPHSIGKLFPKNKVKEEVYYSKEEKRPFPLGIMAVVK